MSYPAISLTTATAGRIGAPHKRLQTARQIPVYPNSSPDHRACNSLTPLPLFSRRPSVSIGGFGPTGSGISSANSSILIPIHLRHEPLQRILGARVVVLRLSPHPQLRYDAVEEPLVQRLPRAELRPGQVPRQAEQPHPCRRGQVRPLVEFGDVRTQRGWPDRTRWA